MLGRVSEVEQAVDGGHDESDDAEVAAFALLACWGYLLIIKGEAMMAHVVMADARAPC